MAVTSRCFTPVLGKKIRVTMLNEDGTVPAAGTSDVSLVTDGFVEIDLKSEIEDGDEIIQKTASGVLCVNELQPSAFKRFTVDITFCGVNPYLFTMITSADVYYDASGAVVGFSQPEGAITSQFALELWTGLSGTKTASGYLLFPLMNGGTFGDLKIDGKDSIDFQVTGCYTEGGNSWGEGPYSVIAGAGTNATQTVTMSGTPTAGTFELSFGGNATSALQFDATSSEVQAALEALSSVGTGNVLVSGGPFPGTPMTVEFRNALGSSVQPLLAVTNDDLTGGTSPSVAVMAGTAGAEGAASPLPTPVSSYDHMLVLVTDVDAPAADCSPVALPAGV